MAELSAIHLTLLQCSGEADVNIQVVDFNDCPLEFVQPPPSYTIPEDAILGSVLVDFTINDYDSGLNGANGSRFSIIAGRLITVALFKMKLFFSIRCIRLSTVCHCKN